MHLTWTYWYAFCQVLYFFGFLPVFYFLALPVDWVETPPELPADDAELPLIVMAYPVLRESMGTMSSTMTTLDWLEYPKSRFRVIAIPNQDDARTIESLERLQQRFTFLEIMAVPPVGDPSWDVVWRAWQGNPKAYWFHHGATRGDRNLPPKKTRQLIYFLYHMIDRIGTDWLLDYIDADSMPPPDHFRSAAAGMRHYQMLQATNLCGNLLDSLPASLHAFDHMCWDGLLYPHMSANGQHPYYVLGKGLFYRAQDLWELGGFNPWTAIEDPEVGMRLWTNGRRLGIIAQPLIEEVPRTFIRGILQRNRWMCGFFQSVGRPLKRMGMPFWRRVQARINLIPVLSLPVNVIGLPTGGYALYLWIEGYGHFPVWVIVLSVVNICFYFTVLGITYTNAWKRTHLVLDRTALRIWYMLRVNPVILFVYHTLWTIPILIGFAMFVTNRGKTWLRTHKYDADRHIAQRGAGELKERHAAFSRRDQRRRR